MFGQGQYSRAWMSIPGWAMFLDRAIHGITHPQQSLYRLWPWTVEREPFQSLLGL